MYFKNHSLLLLLILISLSCQNNKEKLDLNLKYTVGDKFKMEIHTVIKDETTVISHIETTMDFLCEEVIDSGQGYTFRVNVNSLIDTSVNILSGKRMVINFSRKVTDLSEEEYEKYLEVKKLLEESLVVNLTGKNQVNGQVYFADGSYAPDYMTDLANLFVQFPPDRHPAYKSWRFYTPSRLNYSNEHICSIESDSSESITVSVNTTLRTPYSINTGTKKQILNKNTGLVKYGVSVIEMSYGMKMYDTIRTGTLGNIYTQNKDSLDEAAFKNAKNQNTILSYKQYLRDYPEGIHVQEAENLSSEKSNLSDVYWSRYRQNKQFRIRNYNQRIEQSSVAKPVKPVTKLIAGHELVLVKGGLFYFGDTNKLISQQPEYEVTLSDYYIGKYEITYSQYDFFCLETGRSNPSDNEWGRNNRPVTNITWNDAVAYCMWLSKSTGYIIELPTEAQWEYAARGGLYSRGFRYSGSDIADSVTIISDKSVPKTQPVGSRLPNELGIFDMTGNVFEWCSDWYRENPYNLRSIQNPAGPASGTYRSLRGGSFYFPKTLLVDRYFNKEDGIFKDVGFRIVMRIKE